MTNILREPIESLAVAPQPGEVVDALINKHIQSLEAQIQGASVERQIEILSAPRPEDVIPLEERVQDFAKVFDALLQAAPRRRHRSDIRREAQELLARTHHLASNQVLTGNTLIAIDKAQSPEADVDDHRRAQQLSSLFNQKSPSWSREDRAHLRNLADEAWKRLPNAVMNAGPTTAQYSRILSSLEPQPNTYTAYQRQILEAVKLVDKFDAQINHIPDGPTKPVFSVKQDFGALCEATERTGAKQLTAQDEKLREIVGDAILARVKHFANSKPGLSDSYGYIITGMGGSIDGPIAEKRADKTGAVRSSTRQVSAEEQGAKVRFNSGRRTAAILVGTIAAETLVGSSITAAAQSQSLAASSISQPLRPAGPATSPAAPDVTAGLLAKIRVKKPVSNGPATSEAASTNTGQNVQPLPLASPAAAGYVQKVPNASATPQVVEIGAPTAPNSHSPSASTPATEAAAAPNSASPVPSSVQTQPAAAENSQQSTAPNAPVVDIGSTAIANLVEKPQIVDIAPAAPKQYAAPVQTELQMPTAPQTIAGTTGQAATLLPAPEASNTTVADIESRLAFDRVNGTNLQVITDLMDLIKAQDSSAVESTSDYRTRVMQIVRQIDIMRQNNYKTTYDQAASYAGYWSAYPLDFDQAKADQLLTPQYQQYVPAFAAVLSTDPRYLGSIPAPVDMPDAVRSNITLLLAEAILESASPQQLQAIIQSLPQPDISMTTPAVTAGNTEQGPSGGKALKGIASTIGSIVTGKQAAAANHRNAPPSHLHHSDGHPGRLVHHQPAKHEKMPHIIDTSGLDHETALALQKIAATSQTAALQAQVAAMGLKGGYGKHFNIQGAFALVGNCTVEGSGCNPHQVQIGYGHNPSDTAPTMPGDIHNIAGYGIWQFTYGPLQDLFTSFCDQHKWSTGSLYAQVQFMFYYVSAHYPDMIDRMNNAPNVEAATNIFRTEFERPNVPNEAARESAAKAMLKTFQHAYRTIHGHEHHTVLGHKAESLRDIPKVEMNGILAKGILHHWGKTVTGNSQPHQDLQTIASHHLINNLVDTHGDPTTLDPRLMAIEYEFATEGEWKVTYWNMVTGHGWDPMQHPRGKATDIGAVTNLKTGESTNFDPGSAGFNPVVVAQFRHALAVKAEKYAPGSWLGQGECGAGFQGPLAPTISTGTDTCNHQHFELPYTPITPKAAVDIRDIAAVINKK